MASKVMLPLGYNVDSLVLNPTQKTMKAGTEK